MRQRFMLKFLLLGGLLLPALLFAAENRDAKIISDRTNVVATGRWIYNDLPKAFAEATRTGKPLLVVFRCIP
jgi:serine protease Do